MSQIGRFFRPKMLLIPAGFLFVAFLLTAYLVNDFFTLNRIRIGGVLFVLALVVLGLGTVVIAFPRGCKRCGVVLARRTGIYAPNMYESLAALIATPEPAAIAQLAAQRTMEVLHQRANVSVESCPQCQRVMVIKVVEESWRESYYHANRYSPDLEYTDDVAASLLALVG